MIDRIYELINDSEMSHTVSVLPNSQTNTYSACELDLINSVIESGQVKFFINSDIFWCDISEVKKKVKKWIC